MRFAQTLWELLPRSPFSAKPKARPSEVRAAPGPKPGPATGMQARYDELVNEMKRVHGVRVVKWRRSMSGCAWEVRYVNGRRSRLIEAPYPKGPMSCAIFMHEIGHHAIGLSRYRPRCLEEYHAWRWGLDEMTERGFNVTPRVLERRDDALRYAVAKAVRRGLKQLPVELAPYLHPVGSAGIT